MAALSSLAVFCRCATSMRSPTGLDLASSNASRATVRSGKQEKERWRGPCQLQQVDSRVLAATVHWGAYVTMCNEGGACVSM